MIALPTYALLAVVATWPVFAVDWSVTDRYVPDPPVAEASAWSPTAQAPPPPAPQAPTPVANAFGDQVPPPPPPPPPDPVAAPSVPPPPPPPAKVTAAKVVDPARAPQAAESPKVVAATAATPAPQAPAREQGQLVNVAFEISLLERGDASTPARVVTLRVADRQKGQLRQDLTTGAMLNIDLQPRIIDANRVSVELGVEFYQREKVSEGNWQLRSQMRTRVDVILKNGEATTVSQWSDPSVNRSMDIVVKATQMR